MKSDNWADYSNIYWQQRQLHEVSFTNKTCKSFIQSVSLIFDMKLVYVQSSMKCKQAAEMWKDGVSS